ncbi:hypothetical protein [Atopomonas hussainii]|uniref:hypothetical protein n=1 Tax=Atopomonas hussainii TaxID=1429083 RepID=UPI00090016CC|nr:hypothetical protein [Atopomonas hussainii]
MLPGIPSKKANFKRFSGGCAVDVCLLGETMYALYSLNSDTRRGPSSFLKRIDLDGFDGNFDGVPNSYEANVEGLRILSFANGFLMVGGWVPEVMTADCLTPVYSEIAGKLNPEWSDYGWVYCWAGLIYRGPHERERDKGIYVIDVERQCVVRHLDLDIDWSKAWQGSLIFGERQNGNFLVYCLDKQLPLLDVTLTRYRQSFPNKKLMACIEADLAYVLVADHLLVFDLVTGDLVRELNYINSPAMQAHIHTESMDANWACAGDLSVCNGEVVLSHAGVGGYSLYLAPFRDEPFVWLWSAGRDVTAKNHPGDLIFGLSGSIPMAWDKYTGEVVWDTKKPTATSRVTVGDQWVVFSQTSEYIQGHHWKKPYISPHRPKAE